MHIKKALVAVTSTEKIPKVNKGIGLWLGQAAHFYNILTKEGWHVDFVSPKGGYTPIDPISLQMGTDQIDWKLYADPDFRHKIANTHKPSDIDSSHYDCIFFTGGHGSMFDFYNNKELQQIARKIYQKGGKIATTCHGSVALLNLKLSDGQQLLKNRKVTGFSNEQQKEIKIDKELPFLLEDQLKKKGAAYSKHQMFKPYCVVDGRVITGQNKFSTDAVAKAVLQHEK